MLRAAAGALLVAGAAAHPADRPLYDALRANSRRTWEPARPEENVFRGWDMAAIKAALGTQLPPRPPSSSRGPLATAAPTGLPRDFDARVNFGACSGVIRDQKNCGSCWAFGAAETLSDNLCVSGETQGEALSAQDLVSCNTANHGCNGGTLPDAWKYLVSTGVVSDACEPYASGDGSNHTCPAGCTANGGSPAKHRCAARSGTYNTLDNDTAIRNAVFQTGAVEAGMWVYEDFMSYKSGVYRHDNTTGSYALGGHALKIVGWGDAGSNGGEYWLVANSWGTAWGMDGYFKIATWREDMDSGFAIAGGFNCGDLSPPPPAPATPAPPGSCKDEMDHDYCANFKQSEYCQKVSPDLCLETCGCCVVGAAPTWCPKQ